MKKIGIIGGLSAQSTIEYYKLFVEEYNRRKGGNSSPLLVIDSLDLGQISSLMSAGSWDKVFAILEKSVNDLLAAGAEIVLLATNSPHMVYDRLVKKIAVPFPSIMEATADAIKSKGLKKVGLIGTRFTMSNDFYHKFLLQYEIETISPSKEDQEVIDNIIWKELTFNILTEDSKKKYLNVISNLQKTGAEGIILGCTEIPLLIKEEDCEIPTFDTTTLHTLYVLDIALEVEK